ncbi:hypothetical protein [Agromyces larvae]|uniref:Uncharacterized protein n=1 Tax=Agromyces larvae TaxID=2929802 RepID=A0ABY4C384_9MICO|nr:hypothetical protein [Agromyces larvae]UOE45938.1 hypothetical protein MTO99_09415 [Agromyces larvae]
MRYRIIIDTQDAEQEPEAPFTLNVHRDDDDGTPSVLLHEIGTGGGALIGSDIPSMLRDLADAWGSREVIHEGDDESAIRSAAEWRESEKEG